MENKTEEKLLNDRINGLENRIGCVDKKVDTLETRLDVDREKNDERHLDMVKLTTELQGTSKATEQNTSRMASSIEGLVEELKQSNSRTDERFQQLDKDVSEVKSRVNSREFDKTMRLEEKKLSNGVLISIIGGGFVLLEVLIKIIAPLIGL